MPDPSYVDVERRRLMAALERPRTQGGHLVAEMLRQAGLPTGGAEPPERPITRDDVYIGPNFLDDLQNSAGWQGYVKGKNALGDAALRSGGPPGVMGWALSRMLPETPVEVLVELATAGLGRGAARGAGMTARRAPVAPAAVPQPATLPVSARPTARTPAVSNVVEGELVTRSQPAGGWATQAEHEAALRNQSAQLGEKHNLPPSFWDEVAKPAPSYGAVFQRASDDLGEQHRQGLISLDEMKSRMEALRYRHRDDPRVQWEHQLESDAAENARRNREAWGEAEAEARALRSAGVTKEDVRAMLAEEFPGYSTYALEDAPLSSWVSQLATMRTNRKHAQRFAEAMQEAFGAVMPVAGSSLPPPPQRALGWGMPDDGPLI